MDHCRQNISGNSAAAPPQTDPVIIANSDESGKRGRKEKNTRKINKKKRALPQEAKEAKRIKEAKEELCSNGEELNQFNAALSNIQSKIMELGMQNRLELLKMALQEKLMVDILDAMEEDDFVKVYDLYDLLQNLFSI